MLIIGKKLSPYALLSISGLLAASDQAVKWLVQQSMAYGEYEPPRVSRRLFCLSQAATDMVA